MAFPEAGAIMKLLKVEKEVFLMGAQGQKKFAEELEMCEEREVLSMRWKGPDSSSRIRKTKM